MVSYMEGTNHSNRHVCGYLVDRGSGSEHSANAVRLEATDEESKVRKQRDGTL